MLNILAAGFAYPPNIIDNNALVKLGLEPSTEAMLRSSACGISERRTSLPLDYITNTSLFKPKFAMQAACCTPTDLAVEAAEMALSQAGVAKESVGLIIADCATALQTTPSEAQRVGKRFNSKAKAYDLAAGSIAFSVQLNSLLGWQEDRIPEFVLLISTNTPTHSIDYKSGFERLFFGDGAAALLLSVRHAGKFAVKQANFSVRPNQHARFTIDTYGLMHFDPSVIEPYIRTEIESLLKTADRTAPAKLIGPQLSDELNAKLAANLGISPGMSKSNMRERGNTLGSSAMTVLAENYESFKAGDRIVITEAGTGLGVGYIELECLR